MVSVDELKARFGPSLNVAPYGECLVIQGAEFDPDWEVSLGDKGFACHFGVLNGHAVTFVSLNKIVSKSGVVFVPPPKTVIPEVHSNQTEVKETEKVEKKVYALQGPRWTIAEKTELLKEYDRLVAEGKKYGSRIILAELPQFKGRSKNGIDLQLKHLLKKRRAGFEPTPPVSQVEQVEQVERVEKVASVAQGEPTSAREILRNRASGGNMWTKLWRLEEDNLLVELWNRQPKLILKKIFAEFNIKFPERSFGSVGNRLTGLQNEGRIQPRWKLKRKGAKVAGSNPARATNAANDAEKSEKSIEEVEVKVAFPEDLLKRIEDLNRKAVVIDRLSQAYDSLSSAIVELKTKLNEQARLIQEILLANQCIEENFDELRRDLIRHKHAVSGEAMPPWEA
jgi:hypothetical protein